MLGHRPALEHDHDKHVEVPKSYPKGQKNIMLLLPMLLFLEESVVLEKSASKVLLPQLHDS